MEVKLLHRHDQRDAAILELVSAAGRNVRPRLLTAASESFDGRSATLWVIDPDSFGCSIASNYSVNGLDQADPKGQLAALVDGLYLATRESIPRWRRESADLLAEIKADCRAIVSELVKLAVDPAPGNPEQNLSTVAATPPQRSHLACQFPGTADAVYFALGDLPNVLERRLKEPDIASAQAVHLDELIPAGEGEDLRQTLLRKLWTRVMGNELPARIDDKLERQLMARIRRHDGRDQRRYLLAARGPSAWIAESQYADWAQALHIGLVLYEDGECPYLLVEEPDLIDSVREYLELVEDC